MENLACASDQENEKEIYKERAQTLYKREEKEYSRKKIMSLLAEMVGHLGNLDIETHKKIVAFCNRDLKNSVEMRRLIEESK